MRNLHLAYLQRMNEPRHAMNAVLRQESHTLMRVHIPGKAGSLLLIGTPPSCEYDVLQGPSA